MLLTKPGRCHLREEASEPCLKVADIVAKVGEGRLRRNNRIAMRKSLNHLAYRGLLPRIPKIFLQQYRPVTVLAGVTRSVSAVWGIPAAKMHRHHVRES